MSLSLRPISTTESGDAVGAVTLPTDRPLIVGRSADADWSVPDRSVSRRHASIARRGADWFITDLSSRHGTFVNDRRLDPNEPITIYEGDVIAFASWRCRAASGSPRPGVSTSFAPTAGEPASVSAIPARKLGGVAQRGLEVLMELTARLDAADSREQMARAVVKAVREATACRRVMLIEPAPGDELSVLASTSSSTACVSRSLIDRASRDGLVELVDGSSRAGHAASIIDLGIRSAICAPVLVDAAPDAFLMVDTRDAEGAVPGDAAAFCHAVVRLSGLAFQRLRASTMAERHRQLQADLDAARRAQELLSPPRHGRCAATRYRFESIPGRVVAGDLFDIFELDSKRAAFFLGDVSGKGVGAAMLMAACQSQLRSQLLSGVELASAMAAVNADLHRRTDPSKFVTLIGGVIDAERRVVQIGDAGHGLCVLVRDGARPSRIEPTPGFPLGVVDSTDYDTIEVELATGSALVVFSDGAVEQPDPAGAQFGLEGVQRSLATGGAREGLVDAVIQGVRDHASATLADDLTVAALWHD